MLEIISGHPFLLNICVQNVPIAPRNVYNYYKYFLFALTKQLTSKIMFYAGYSDISKQQGQGQSEFVIVLSVQMHSHDLRFAVPRESPAFVYGFVLRRPLIAVVHDCSSLSNATMLSYKVSL